MKWSDSPLSVTCIIKREDIHLLQILMEVTTILGKVVTSRVVDDFISTHVTSILVQLSLSWKGATLSDSFSDSEVLMPLLNCILEIKNRLICHLNLNLHLFLFTEEKAEENWLQHDWRAHKLCSPDTHRLWRDGQRTPAGKIEKQIVKIRISLYASTVCTLRTFMWHLWNILSFQGISRCSRNYYINSTRSSAITNWLLLYKAHSFIIVLLP